MKVVGIIVIGRNEGEKLKAALHSSVAEKEAICIYVDSGSTDGSVELARSMGIKVHELDPSLPFSAARARREGVEILRKDYPRLDFFQFLDGDCTLLPSWLSLAVEHFNRHQDVAIVSGMLREAAPERSVYNRINAMQWNVSPGEINACGGIFMIRRAVYEETGGFNPLLLTGEEPELCARVRAAGYRIVRLGYEMACHDSGMVRFSEWWKRAVWGGYGDAVEYDVLGAKVIPQRRRETRSSILWGVGVPVIALCGIIGIFWSLWFAVIPIICVVGYLALWLKIMLKRMRNLGSSGDAAVYAFFCILRKVPGAVGFLLYQINKGVRHKMPDPHSPHTNQ